MEGGWNQAPPAVTGQVDNLDSFGVSSSNDDYSNDGCVSSRRPKLSSSNQKPRASPPSKLSAFEKDIEVNGSNNDKPNFVYKPASENFFKNMAGIGKSKRFSSESSQDSDSVPPGHKRHISRTSTSSLEHPEIPRHPSYQVLGPCHRSPSPGLTHPRRAVSPNTPLSNQKRCTLSPSATVRDSSTIEEESTGYTSSTDPEPSPKHPAPSPPVFRAPVFPSRSKAPDSTLDSKKQKRKTRTVTSEMVPSATELFG